MAKLYTLYLMCDQKLPADKNWLHNTADPVIVSNPYPKVY